MRAGEAQMGNNEGYEADVDMEHKTTRDFKVSNLSMESEASS